MIRRRSFMILAPVAALALACKKEPRCETCGMKLDRASSWYTEVDGLQPHAFDTPRCAISYWLGLGDADKKRATLVLQDYYERTKLRGEDARLVVGSDVLGPMGEDYVPVSAARADKFVADHGGRAMRLADVGPKTLEERK